MSPTPATYFAGELRVRTTITDVAQQDDRSGPRPDADDADARAETVVARMVERHGSPSLEHYRAVYADLGVPWPGDEEIRRAHPVACTT